MSARDFAVLSPHLEPLILERGHVVAEPHQPISHVYFLESGVASTVAVGNGKRGLEVGIYGREGFGPIALITGIDSTPQKHFIQVEGWGYRMPVGAFADAFERSPELRALLLRYLFVCLIQTSCTALSNGSDVIGDRLARWLLMCHDRIDGDDLVITHEFLGIMLNVRRSGVTDAIHLLEGERVIRAVRGHIEIRDRARLEIMAGGSYGVPEDEHARHVGPLRKVIRRAA